MRPWFLLLCVTLLLGSTSRAADVSPGAASATGSLGGVALKLREAIVLRQADPRWLKLYLSERPGECGRRARRAEPAKSVILYCAVRAPAGTAARPDVYPIKKLDDGPSAMCQYFRHGAECEPLGEDVEITGGKLVISAIDPAGLVSGRIELTSGKARATVQFAAKPCAAKMQASDATPSCDR